jgi:wyosine [tRNA(Phe)-imidazoG37] synthetase (radical SAM superfamily)
MLVVSQMQTTADPTSARGFTYLFGPVNSRRLGRSLGVDLLPYKTCSLDCIYCECGPTTDLTTERLNHVPTDDVIVELDAYLGTKPPLDFVTFAGSGEPTLHAGLGRIIAHLKQNHPQYKVAVLTNGTLFSSEASRRDVLGADLLVPSLDGATLESFRAINRPAPGITVEKVIDGLVALRRDYQGTYVLEVFIVPGINDTDAEVLALRKAAERIQPDAIQLNRLDRPGILPAIKAASDELLASIRTRLEPLTVFVVPKRQPGEVRRVDDSRIEDAILGRLTDRSFDTTTLSFLLGLHEGLVAKHVNQMLGDGRLTRVISPGPQGHGQANRIFVRRAS